MTATIHRLRVEPMFTIDVSTDGPRAVGSFPVGDDCGATISDATIGIVEPAFLSGGHPGQARVVAIGDIGRELLRRALGGAFTMRCRAVPDGMRWKLVGVAE